MLFYGWKAHCCKHVHLPSDSPFFLVAARCIQNQAWGYKNKNTRKVRQCFWCFFLPCCVFYVKDLHARLGSSASFSRATPHQSLQLVLQSYPGQHRSLFDQLAHMVQKYVRMGSLQVSARPQCTHKNCRATQSSIKSYLILCWLILIPSDITENLPIFCLPVKPQAWFQTGLFWATFWAPLFLACCPQDDLCTPRFLAPG